ncbi:MAG: autoinducer synthase [Alphaproteobacteria bacterium]|nr:autoinducer synthase [Alphaproteobacteria bacterium]
MIECFNYETAHFFGDSLAQQYKLRHKIFIERQDWKVPNFNRMEYDQYDTPAAHYLVYKDATGVARGVARLIPTFRPYMLQEVFPHMIKGSLISSSVVWEGTRFGIDHTLEPIKRKQILNELVCAWFEFGLKHNISKYLLLTQVFVLKTFQRMGCEIELLGEKTTIDRKKVVAASVKVSSDILQNVQRKTGLNRNILITSEDLIYKKAA